MIPFEDTKILEFNHYQKFVKTPFIIYADLDSLIKNRWSGLRSATLLKKETLAQVPSCKFCEISKNTFIYRTPPVAASCEKYITFSVLIEKEVTRIGKNG